MSELFESKWGETKAALTEGLAGNKKKTMDVVLENTKKYLAEQARPNVSCRPQVSWMTSTRGCMSWSKNFENSPGPG